MSTATTFNPAKSFHRYSAKAFDLIPLHMPTDKRKGRNGKVQDLGKAPVHLDWTKRPYRTDKVRAAAIEAGRNLGVRLREDQLVIDVDPRNGGDEGFSTLCHDLELDPDEWPRVITGSGGWHCYMTKPADVLVRDTLEEYAGVEFKTKGRQVVAAGARHPNGKFYKWSKDHPRIEDGLPMIPTTLLERIKRPPRSSLTGGGQYDQMQIAELLSKLDPEDFSDQTTWFQLMQACHHASNGVARHEFIDWSTQDPAYANDADIIGRRWDSLDADRDDGITFKTLNMHVAKAGHQASLPAPDVGDDFDDIDDGDVSFRSDGDEDALRMFGVTGDDGVKPEAPPLADWQFIVDSLQFIHDDGLQRWNREQFAMLHGGLSRKGDVITDIKRGKIKIRKFERQVYIPKSPPVMRYEGESVFNIWRASAMTPKAGDHQWFLDHVAYMFPDKKSQAHILDFMAQLIQFPEVKIHFALLIQSNQGVGKGAVAMILRKIIGKRNTVEPSNDEVTKAWTGWQEGASLAIINELMAGGSAVVLNRLKSPITEDTLRIEKKFGNSFSIPNHMNLFAMTNHKDALPIPADDRRWLILFSSSKKQSADYYDGLFANIADDAKVAAVMQFLLDRFITFNPKGPAPMTEAKRDMADRSKTDVAILLKDMFNERRAPFDFDLVRMADIVAKIKEEPGEKNVNKTAATFLDDIGAAKLDKDKNALPSYQLYAVRDHARYQAMGRAETLEQFKGEHPDIGGDDE